MRLIVALWQDVGLATVTQNIIHRFDDRSDGNVYF